MVSNHVECNNSLHPFQTVRNIAGTTNNVTSKCLQKFYSSAKRREFTRQCEDSGQEVPASRLKSI